MDHTWFQVIESRSGPDQTYSACAQKTQVPLINEEARGQYQLPQEKTPKHEHKRIKLVIIFHFLVQLSFL